MTDTQNAWALNRNKQLTIEFLSGMQRLSDPLRTTEFTLSSPKQPSIVRHLKLFQLIGSTPLSLTPPNFSKISMPALSLTLVLGILNAAHVFDPNLSWRCLGKITKYVTLFSNLVFTVTPFLVTCVALQKRFLLEKTLNNLIRIQRRLLAIEYRLFGSTLTMIVVFIAIMAGFFVYRVVLLFTVDSNLLWLRDDAMRIVYHTFLFANSIKVSYLLKCVATCFSRLSATQSSETCSKESIKDFVRTYSQLVDIVEELNAVSDVTITAYLLNTYVKTLDMTTEIFIGSTHHWWDRFWFYAWMLVPILGAYYLFDTCHKLTNQAEECNAAMMNSVVFHKSDAVQSNPLVMIHLSGKKSVTFKSCDCFIIDYSFGISMIAAFITYIVILYQMEKDASSSTLTSSLPSNSSC